MAPPVIAPEALAFKLGGSSVRLCPSTIYRSVLRRARCAAVITCWTVRPREPEFPREGGRLEARGVDGQVAPTVRPNAEGSSNQSPAGDTPPVARSTGCARTRNRPGALRSSSSSASSGKAGLRCLCDAGDDVNDPGPRSTLLSLAGPISEYNAAARTPPRSRAAEQPRLPPQGNPPGRHFSGAIRGADAAIVDDADQLPRRRSI